MCKRIGLLSLRIQARNVPLVDDVFVSDEPRWGLLLHQNPMESNHFMQPAEARATILREGSIFFERRCCVVPNYLSAGPDVYPRFYYWRSFNWLEVANI